MLDKQCSNCKWCSVILVDNLKNLVKFGKEDIYKCRLRNIEVQYDDKCRDYYNTIDLLSDM